MDNKYEFDDFLDTIEKRITEVIPQIEPKKLYEPFSYIMQGGGKRIRPLITMITAGVVGGNPLDAVDAGVALEILHNFTLVHDDIMDNSPKRRGRDTVHVKWNNDIAILTGDVMVGYAYSLLPNSKQHEKSDLILKTFTNELIEVCEGQVLDMEFNFRKDVKMEDYLNMIDKKTARLLETSAVIGAYIGHGSDEEVEAIRYIARNWGLAFQIQDDLLDMTANEGKLGKKIGKDIVEGKKTYLINAANNNIKVGEDRILLDEFYEKNGLDISRVPEMDDLFKRNGIYEIAEKEINEYFTKSKEKFHLLRKNEYTDIFLWLIESFENRNF
jgi:geranylgeranyl diphosphate synthase type II